jgi:hypothetical protein
MSKRDFKVLSLSDKVKVLHLKKEKKLYAKVAKICGKKESSICELMKKKKEIHFDFAVIP